MLYMPGIFGEDLMDRWFDDMDREFAQMEKPLYGHNAKNVMKTDVREHDDSYEVDIELPGFHKDEVQLSLENGYLNITAEDKKTGKLIRQERYAGSMSRSFYVGEDVTEEDIKAKLEHGVLSLQIPKKEAKPQVPEKKYIAIEG